MGAAAMGLASVGSMYPELNRLGTTITWSAPPACSLVADARLLPLLPLPYGRPVGRQRDSEQFPVRLHESSEFGLPPCVRLADEGQRVDC